MKTPYLQSALALLVLAAPLFAQTKQKGASVPPAVIPHKFEAKVVGILDGDTIRVANAEVSVLTIRMDGIDAPESKQEFGKEATDFLQKLYHKQVTVQWKEKDKYGRLLGLVYFEGDLVNRSLVENGFAWQFVKYNQSPALKELEQAARTKKLGLWAKDSPIAPWDWRDGVRPVQVVQKQPEAKPAAPEVKEPEKPKSEEVTVYLTDTGTHYHRAGCRHLKKSSISIPLSRASGYAPCKTCRPPQ